MLTPNTPETTFLFQNNPVAHPEDHFLQPIPLGPLLAPLPNTKTIWTRQPIHTLYCQQPTKSNLRHTTNMSNPFVIDAIYLYTLIRQGNYYTRYITGVERQIIETVATSAPAVSGGAFDIDPPTMERIETAKENVVAKVCENYRRMATSSTTAPSPGDSTDRLWEIVDEQDESIKNQKETIKSQRETIKNQNEELRQGEDGSASQRKTIQELKETNGNLEWKLYKSNNIRNDPMEDPYVSSLQLTIRDLKERLQNSEMKLVQQEELTRMLLP